MSLVELLEKGLYVIETTTDDKANSHERTLVSDYFSNRILRNEAFGSKDIPVPGTFKKPEEWNKEFKDRGLEVKNQETSDGPDRKNMAVAHTRWRLDKTN